MAVSVLHLVSKEDDRQAGLALVASLRKRLMNLPGDLAADETWRVRSSASAGGLGIETGAKLHAMAGV